MSLSFSNDFCLDLLKRDMSDVIPIDTSLYRSVVFVLRSSLEIRPIVLVSEEVSTGGTGRTQSASRRGPRS